MECDRVFVALTAGPFPSGRDSDAVVELHLIACAGCRRIAEALQPHDQQRHEALPIVERQALPRYSGAQRPVTAMAAVLRGSNAPARAVKAAWPNPSNWRRELTAWAPEAQVASYSLSPRRRSATAVEAISMLATLAGAALAFWFLGVLTL